MKRPAVTNHPGDTVRVISLGTWNDYLDLTKGKVFFLKHQKNRPSIAVLYINSIKLNCNLAIPAYECKLYISKKLLTEKKVSIIYFKY